MRLLSATVRAYRLHRETTVSFDPSLTLIGGPNEAGKSTFAEAIHRALFLKAKGNTAEHRSMKSNRHAGAPEVELAFEAAGKHYQLRKRFGSGGDTTLIPAHATALTGEAAETELARVLGVEAGASGKTAVGQWSHLWVWQTESANNPTSHATSQRDHLLLRLQTLGGAAAMQSEHDSRTAAAVAASYLEIFTTKGTRGSSSLGRAEAEAAEAEAAETAARARVQALEESVRSITEAAAALAEINRALPEIAAQLDEAGGRENRIRRLLAQETTQAAAYAAAAGSLTSLEQQENQLATLRGQLAALESELAPLDANTSSLTSRAAATRQAAEAASREADAAAGALAGARQRHDLARSRVQELETAARLAALTQRSDQAAGHRAAMSALQLELAALPPVDAAALTSLRKLEAASHAAAAALTAMAAGVELLKADGPVLLGGNVLEPGEVRILTEETELNLGGAWALRIRPGGGVSLATARETEAQARRQCLAALEKCGVGSMEEAATSAARRADLQARLMALEAALKSLDAASLPALLTDARSAHAAAAAESARRTEALATACRGGISTPSLEDPHDFLTEASRALTDAESTAGRQKTLKDVAARAEAEAVDALRIHQESLQGRHSRRTGLKANLELLLTNYGDDAARTAALIRSRQGRAEAAAVLARTRQMLNDLQPEENARTLTRLARARETLKGQQAGQETKHAVAADQLRSDGSHDPAAALEFAIARAAAARETVARLRLQAAARRLLHEAFTAEQTAMADRFTRPLAEGISGYLECLFGPGTRAEVALEDHAFGGLKLSRPSHAGGAVEFDSLSGGTREQTAAAVRLAMAEVLAPAHDGCLPVVFDDAFAYSDRTRIRSLQSMLDLAAARWLQVILLTHQPEAYAALGAASVTFSNSVSAPAGTAGTGLTEEPATPE